jgi:hypothetical protein
MKKIILIIIVFSFIACNHDNDGRQPWPGGKIPFIMIGFTPEEEFEIFKSMLTWELASGGKVEFFIVGTRETENKPLYISKGKDQMTIGSGYDPGGINYMTLNSFGQFDLNHEIGHALGLYHEFTRPDRDLYVTINLDRIGNDILALTQFIPIEPKLYDYEKYPFDYLSIMMYKDSGTPPIIDFHGNNTCGETPSIIDALKVRDIYTE